MSSQPLSHREEYLLKKRKARLIKYGFILFLLIILFVGTVFLSRMQKFRISSVELSGNTLVSNDEVSAAAKNFMSGNYFWFFPKNNDLLYQHNSLQNFLAEKFQRIDTISVHLKNSQTLSIAITERPLTALWCSGMPEDVPAGVCYFMDDNGLIFAESPDFSGDAYFKYYGRVASSTTPIGTQYIASTTLFKDFGKFIKRAQDLSLHPIYLQSTGDEQFTVGLAGGGYIYIDTKEPLAKSADNLQALLGTISATATTTLNFDYIDLRFGNKLYYKLE